MPDSVDLNALARWSHSAGHVDANMAKVPTLYALLGGHLKGTSAYIMCIGVHLAKNGSAIDGRTAINVLIAVMRALRASGTENLQPDVLREVYRRKACELPVSPYGNPRFRREITKLSPVYQAFDALNIWIRYQHGTSYFRGLSKLTSGYCRCCRQLLPN